MNVIIPHSGKCSGTQINKGANSLFQNHSSDLLTGLGVSAQTSELLFQKLIFYALLLKQSNN